MASWSNTQLPPNFRVSLSYWLKSSCKMMYDFLIDLRLRELIREDVTSPEGVLPRVDALRQNLVPARIETA